MSVPAMMPSTQDMYTVPLASAILKDMRAFRHNIINSLHSLRGVIASGDISEQTIYYESLARELSRLNNENVVAITQIRFPALQALLLEKVKAASDAVIPVYLYTKGNPVLRGENGRQFSAVAGILLDNAIEAAADSEAGNVRVEIRQTQRELSLFVLNTYPTGLDVTALITGRPSSTKTNHMGIGLSIAEEIVKKNPRMSYTRCRRGRYIESVLALENG